MKFVYRPEGADPMSWEFAPAKMMSPEAETIERLTKMTFVQWQNAVQDGSMLATRALLFVLLKRATPGIKFDTVQFSMAEIDWELGDEERTAVIAALTAKQDSGETMTPDEKQLLEELIADDDSTATPEDAPEDPKAP